MFSSVQFNKPNLSNFKDFLCAMLVDNRCLGVWRVGCRHQKKFLCIFWKHYIPFIMPNSPISFSQQSLKQDISHSLEILHFFSLPSKRLKQGRDSTHDRCSWPVLKNLTETLKKAFGYLKNKSRPSPAPGMNIYYSFLHNCYLLDGKKKFPKSYSWFWNLIEIWP